MQKICSVSCSHIDFHVKSKSICCKEALYQILGLGGDLKVLDTVPAFKEHRVQSWDES